MLSKRFEMDTILLPLKIMTYSIFLFITLSIPFIFFDLGTDGPYFLRVMQEFYLLTFLVAFTASMVNASLGTTDYIIGYLLFALYSVFELSFYILGIFTTISFSHIVLFLVQFPFWLSIITFYLTFKREVQ